MYGETGAGGALERGAGGSAQAAGAGPSGSHFRPELSADVGVGDGYVVDGRSRII